MKLHYFIQCVFQFFVNRVTTTDIEVHNTNKKLKSDPLGTYIIRKLDIENEKDYGIKITQSPPNEIKT